MSIHLGIVHHDTHFALLKDKPLIINDYKTVTVESRNFIKDMIYSKYDNDVLSSVPRCSCSPSSGHQIVGADRKDELCPHCHSRVKSLFDDDLEPILWARAPNGVEPFINFKIWKELFNVLKSNKVEVLTWLCSTQYNPTFNKRPDILNKLEAMGFERGYNNFVKNFFTYIHELAKMPEFKKKAGMHSLIELIDDNKDKIFSRYIPLTNRSLFIIEPTNVDKIYMDLNGIPAIDAIAMMTSIDAEGETLSVKAKENRTTRFLTSMSIYQEKFLRTNVAKKGGLIRKHNVSTRVAPSFRSVITSITDPHDYEQIVIPWNTAITILEPHIQNHMIKKGFTANEIDELLNKYANKFNQKLYGLMKKILFDYGEKGLPVLWNRNPTLGRSSIVMLFIGDIKKDVNDPTVSMSIGIVALFNADFDGKCFAFVKLF